MSFSIGVIGTGYVGLVSGTSFAAMGNKVLCVDIDEEKIKVMKSGKSPIYEPGLDYLLQRNIKEKRLDFTTNPEKAVLESELIFLCLPTPPNEDGSADLHHVLDVSKDIAEIIKRNDIKDKKIVVNKSTVPVGTADKVKAIYDEILGEHEVFVASNPEFLREGFAVEDAMKPERVVVGSDTDYVREIMADLYSPFLRSGNPVVFMDIKSAEVTKYAANAFLAAKISFMNDLSAYCEVVGADIEKIRLGIGKDSRIGSRFLFAGVGYGGSCFPKDVRALKYSADEVGSPLSIVSATQEVNFRQIKRFWDKIAAKFDGDLSGVTLGVWGIAFKPNTDDVREAPAFRLFDYALESGAKIKAYDPEAAENARKFYGDKIEVADDMYAAAEGADALAVVTEWTAFRNPDFKRLKSSLKEPVIFDGRNLYEPSEMQEFGFDYYPVGRRSVSRKK